MPGGAGGWKIANDRRVRLCAACPGGAWLCLGDSVEKPCKSMRPFFPKRFLMLLILLDSPRFAWERQTAEYSRFRDLPRCQATTVQNSRAVVRRSDTGAAIVSLDVRASCPFRVEADGCRLSTCRCDNRLNLRRCFVGILRPRPVVGQRGHHQDAGQNYDDRRIDGYQSS